MFRTMIVRAWCQCNTNMTLAGPYAVSMRFRINSFAFAIRVSTIIPLEDLLATTDELKGHVIKERPTHMASGPSSSSERSP